MVKISIFFIKSWALSITFLCISFRMIALAVLELLHGVQVPEKPEIPEKPELPEKVRIFHIESGKNDKIT